MPEVRPPETAAAPRAGRGFSFQGQPTTSDTSTTSLAFLPHTTQTCDYDSLNTFALCAIVLHPCSRSRTVPTRIGWDMDDQVKEGPDGASTSCSLPPRTALSLTSFPRASIILSKIASPSPNSQASPTLSHKMDTTRKPTTAPSPTVCHSWTKHRYTTNLCSATTPKCPSTIMQWQHGVYSLPGNGSLVLQPFGVDGRQVMSSPCSYDESVYTRYEQPELIKSYQYHAADPYHNVPRLDLYQFDGKPLQPMYLVLNPPQMLPTQTLNPTATATPTKKAKVKRGQEENGDAEELSPEELRQKLLENNHHPDAPLNKHILLPGRKSERYNPDKFWWIGVGLVAVGTVLYMWPTSPKEEQVSLK